MAVQQNIYQNIEVNHIPWHFNQAKISIVIIKLPEIFIPLSCITKSEFKPCFPSYFNLEFERLFHNSSSFLWVYIYKKYSAYTWFIYTPHIEIHLSFLNQIDFKKIRFVRSRNTSHTTHQFDKQEKETIAFYQNLERTHIQPIKISNNRIFINNMKQNMPIVKETKQQSKRFSTSK